MSGFNQFKKARMDAQAEAQEELWSLRRYNSWLLTSIANLLCGDERDQGRAVDDILRMIEEDVRIARKMVQIMEHNPTFAERFPDLYKRVLSSAAPSTRH